MARMMIWSEEEEDEKDEGNAPAAACPHGVATLTLVGIPIELFDYAISSTNENPDPPICLS